MNLVVPAVLPSSGKDFQEKLARLTGIAGVRRIQIDVVDGKFAAPASWPYTAPAELEERVKKGDMLPLLDRIEYEMDLMCSDAAAAGGLWLSLGATRLTLHAETASDLPRLLASVRDTYGTLVSLGLALNVASDLALIEPCLHELQYVQFMGIAKIGRQGEPLDQRVFEKIRVFRSRHPSMPIQIDGGVSLGSAKKLVAAGATNLVVGSALLRAKDPAATFAAFEELQTSFGV